MSRKITRESIAAFLAGKRFHKANMSVEIDFHNLTPVVSRPIEVMLKLHGNCIARRDPSTGKIEITTAGWNTVTTRARLNGLPGVRVHQHKFELYLAKLPAIAEPWDGEWVAIN